MCFLRKASLSIYLSLVRLPRRRTTFTHTHSLSLVVRSLGDTMRFDSKKKKKMQRGRLGGWLRSERYFSLSRVHSLSLSRVVRSFVRVELIADFACSFSCRTLTVACCFFGFVSLVARHPRPPRSPQFGGICRAVHLNVAPQEAPVCRNSI